MRLQRSLLEQPWPHTSLWLLCRSLRHAAGKPLLFCADLTSDFPQQQAAESLPASEFAELAEAL